MAIVWLFIIIVFLIILYLFVLSKKNAKYFKDRGICYLGNVNYQMVCKNLNLVDSYLFWHKQAVDKNQKIAGVMEMCSPTLVITDPDLLKQIMVKAFDHFVDRRSFKLSHHDYLLKKMLLMVTGDQWKSLRSKVSPTFTTGKIRRMFKIFDTSSRKLVSYFEKETANCSQIDLTDGYFKFTMDVIASAAFGIDSKAFDQKGNSIFQTMGEKLPIKFEGLNLIKIIFMALCPQLSEYLGLSFFSSDVQQFFSQMIKSAIKHREESGERREDFIQLMLEAKQNKHKKIDKNEELTDCEKDAEQFALDDDDITAQSVLFILGGYETTHSLLQFVAYVLALNKDVQYRLLQEVKTSLDDNDGEFTYESVNKMEYLDMVMNETLRLYAPASFADRTCTKEYRIPDSDIVIKKGETISIPILGIQRSEKNYEEPERFDPERWSPENRSKIHPCAFLAFGYGPRMCPGLRFALIEVKLAIAFLVHNFSIELSEKTLIPMKFSSSSTLKPEGGMWLSLKKRL